MPPSPRGRSWGPIGRSRRGSAPPSMNSSRSWRRGSARATHPRHRRPPPSAPALRSTARPSSARSCARIDFMGTQEGPVAALFRLAFAATMVGYSNYSYEPSLGRKASVGRPEVNDSDVAGVIAGKLRQMADDAAWYRAARTNPEREDGRVVEKSFFEGYAALEAGSVDLLVTSPPYLNNYHYNRNTRPHLYWLGFCSSPRDLKRLEDLNFGTYWQNARNRGAYRPRPLHRRRRRFDGRTRRTVRRQQPRQGHLWRQRLGQLRGALFQRLRPLPRRCRVVPAAGGDGAGGHRQLHPARGADPDRPLPRRHRRVPRLRGCGHSRSTGGAGRQQHRRVQRPRRQGAGQRALRIRRGAAAALISPPP